MRMKIVLAILTCGFVLLGSPQLHATTAWRYGAIAELQLESGNRTPYEGVVWIKISDTTWSGTSCPEPWGYFRMQDDNVHLYAMALSARRAGQSLRIMVDDTYPTMSGYCQIVNMSL